MIVYCIKPQGVIHFNVTFDSSDHTAKGRIVRHQYAWVSAHLK